MDVGCSLVSCESSPSLQPRSGQTGPALCSSGRPTWRWQGEGDDLAVFLPVVHPRASRSSSLSLSFLTHKMRSVQCREIARSLGREPLGGKGLLQLGLSRQMHLPVPRLAARIKWGNNRSGRFENCQRERERVSKHLLGAYCVLCPPFIYFNAHMNPFN